MDLGLLQKEVAEKIGVDKTTINNWERQRTMPEIRFIARIVEFLGYNPLPKPTNFKEQLIFVRKRQGLSREKFAKKLGMDPTTLAGWETGGHRASRRSMELIHMVIQRH